MLDCAIIGGGPAGLTAGLYLARFNRSFTLFDNGQSRAAWIPQSHNLPLFTQGIAGPEILRKQHESLERYGASAVRGCVMELAKDPAGFSLQVRESNGALSRHTARFVLLATGVVDIPPRIPDVEDAVQRGLIRYCPICDGYEAKGKKVGVIGGSAALGEAAFIARTYSRDVTILSLHEPLRLNKEERERLEGEGIRYVREPVATLVCDKGKVKAKSAGTSAEYEFDVVYSALGVIHRSGLATALGAVSDEKGALKISDHGETTVPGLYAAGDVTHGLNQIVVAMGQAARAATHIHNCLDCRASPAMTIKQLRGFQRRH